MVSNKLNFIRKVSCLFCVSYLLSACDRVDLGEASYKVTLIMTWFGGQNPVVSFIKMKNMGDCEDAKLKMLSEADNRKSQLHVTCVRNSY